MALQPLQALNKSSARIATFAARLFDAEIVAYTFTSKKDGEGVTAHKFHVTLVGDSPQDYCMCYVKASWAECKKCGREV